MNNAQMLALDNIFSVCSSGCCGRDYSKADDMYLCEQMFITDMLKSVECGIIASEDRRDDIYHC